jgi:hypothetical protein
MRLLTVFDFLDTASVHFLCYLYLLIPHTRTQLLQITLKVVCSLPAGRNGGMVNIAGRHMKRMPDGWLHDEIINAYMWLLQVGVL